MNNSSGTGGASITESATQGALQGGESWNFDAEKQQAGEVQFSPEQTSEVSPAEKVEKSVNLENNDKAEAQSAAPAQESVAPEPVKETNELDNNEHYKALKEMPIDASAKELPSKYVGEAMTLINSSKKNPHQMTDYYNAIQKDVIEKTGNLGGS